MFARIPPERFEEPTLTPEGWSPKDAMFHVAGWLSDCGWVLERIGRGSFDRAAEDALVTQDVHEISFPKPEKMLSPPIIALDNVAVGYEPGKPVLGRVTLRIDTDDRIALLGANGNGKSTLVKLIASKLEPFSGQITRADKLSIGYFAQDHTGTIQRGMTAVDWLHQFDPDAARQDVHGLLGQMLFSGEEGLKPTDALSGGETARLLFCRIMLQKPNVLVLDEPTNHLDLESINALNVALQKYEGTVLLVTHDEDLMEEVGTRVWHFDGRRIEDFRGTYDEYAASLV